jgi:hypothetical protein
MRVEQRIGRIDRIGQRYDEVTILNYSYEDTVETDIYERLDARIGLFENVVGDMQPILSGVSSQIRSATLETERDKSRDAVERADKEFSDRIEKQEESDRVDVGESLDDIDEPLAQDVIDEAKLDAWESFDHPDILDVGADEYDTETPFTVQSLESVLTRSEALVDAGIQITSVDELEIDVTDTEYGDGFDFGECTYRLEVSDIESIPELDTEGTLASVIAPDEKGVAVTFSDECAEEFSSLHYLAPGNPLLRNLIETWKRNSDESERLINYSESVKQSSRPLVCAWGRDDTINVVSDDGTVTNGHPVSSLSKWRDDFVVNREQYSTD